jgi:DNA-directed RNA polymerase specialized sigma24 family protein
VLAASVRRILASAVADALKHYKSDKRDVILERSIEADIDCSAYRLAGRLAADQTSPSDREVRNEELLRHTNALVEFREVVVLKHCQGWTLRHIADHLGKSVPTVASLLRRGLEEPRRQLIPEE